MGRFSPTVLPREFDFGSIIDRAAQGYQFGRGLRRERRQEQERQEDRNRYLASLRAQDLAQPGASTLGEAVDRLNVARLDPDFHPETADEFRQDPSALTPETLARVGSARERDVPIDFTAPEPTEVTLPSGETMPFQERAPYLSGTGIVMDPQRARRERTLGAYLDQQMLGRAEPWQPMSRDEQVAFEGDKARATGLYQQRTRPRAGREPMTYTEATRDLYSLYGSVDENGNLVLPPWVTDEWRREAIEAIRAGEEPPPRPPPPTLPGISAGPPEEEGTPLLERIGQGIGSLTRGFRAGREADEEIAAADARRDVEVGQPPRPRGAPPAAPRIPEGVSQEEADSARAGGRIPVSQAEYEDLAQEYGEGYARQYFVVVR